MYQNMILGAMMAADISFEQGIAQMRDRAGSYGIPDVSEFDKLASDAKVLIYGSDRTTGIASELASSSNAADTFEILAKAMTTFFAQEHKAVGQLARTYTFGFAQALKVLVPDFERLLKKRQESTAG